MKGKADYYEPGDWNALCFECGRKFKASTMLKHWRGYYVCQAHWDMRHPQDYVRAFTPEQPPPWTQPAPFLDLFVDFGTPNGMSAIPDAAQPDVAVPDYLHPAYNPDGDI